MYMFGGRVAWVVFLSSLLFLLHDDSGRVVGAGGCYFVDRVED